MKLTAVLPLLCITAASARATWLGGNNQDQGLLTMDDPLKVPGENPLSFCSDASKDLLLIEKVDLSPNPPEA
jgi:hypothetical protein